MNIINFIVQQVSVAFARVIRRAEEYIKHQILIGTIYATH